jgi:hypothetical protein
MKVHELIAELQRHNQNAEVIYWDEFGWMRATHTSEVRVEPTPSHLGHCGHFETSLNGGIVAVAIECRE